MNDLQRLVKGRMGELDLSYRGAAAKSEGMVSHATLNNIVTGRHSWKIDDKTMRGIAKALDVDLGVVESAVGRAVRIADTEFVLPARANRLSPQERRAVLSMIDALLTSAETSERAAPVDETASGRLDH